MIPENNYQLNLVTVQNIMRDGGILDSEIEIEVSFRGESDELNLLKEELISDGFVFRHNQSSVDNIFLTRVVKLNFQAINEIDKKLYTLAEKNHLVYDGWGYMLD